jgi:hypothetical protein
MEVRLDAASTSWFRLPKPAFGLANFGGVEVSTGYKMAREHLHSTGMLASLFSLLRIYKGLHSMQGLPLARTRAHRYRECMMRLITRSTNKDQ